MRNSFVPWFAYVLLLGCVMQAHALDSRLLAFAPAPADSFVGIRLDTVRHSRLGQYLTRQLTQRNDGGYEEWIRAAGIDPGKDVDEILGAAVDSGEANTMMLAMRGRFDAPRLLAYAKTKGLDIRQLPAGTLASAPGEDMAFAVQEGDILVLGRQGLLQAALSRNPAPTLSTETLAVLRSLAAEHDAWIYSIGSPSRMAYRSSHPTVNGALEGEIIKEIRDFRAGVKMGSMVSVRGRFRTATAAGASALAEALRFFVALARLRTGADGGQQSGAALGRGGQIRLEAAGDAVTVEAAMPENEVERLLRMLQEPSGELVFLGGALWPPAGDSLLPSHSR